MNQTQNLIQTLVSGITPATRSRAAPQALILDTLCLLLDILTPKLRPVSAWPGRGMLPGAGGPCLCSVPYGPQVSTQLYSAREKQQLASLVGTMLTYSLTYRQDRTPDGQYIYRLEP